ncbi:MAG TPA: flagellin, partial [Syntrophales bacterium]|nr:flagellin [Syntrophales bacterium]
DSTSGTQTQAGGTTEETTVSTTGTNAGSASQGTAGTAGTSSGAGQGRGTDVSVDTVIEDLTNLVDSAISKVRAKSAEFGGDVTFLQARLDFTTNYVNTMTEGSGKLTLADLNQEGANLVALQTRQQIGVQSLSIAGQQQQAILSLLR